MGKDLSRYFFPFLYIFLISISFATFFRIENKDLSSYQRLFGMLSLNVIFAQILLGSLMNFFIRLFGQKAFVFHKIQGFFVSFFILSHIALYFIPLLNFIDLKKFFLIILSGGGLGLFLGKIAFFLFLVGLFAAFLRFTPFLRRRWIILHRLQYLVFYFILIHSLLVGSDTLKFPFLFSWIFYFVGANLFLFFKIISLFRSFKRQ